MTISLLYLNASQQLVMFVFLDVIYVSVFAAFMFLFFVFQLQVALVYSV